MRTVKVIRLTKDKLDGEEWIFWYDDHNHALRPSNYRSFTRQSMRHKFRDVETWNRIGRQRMINPPIPGEVQAEAIAQFIEGLAIKFWEER